MNTQKNNKKILVELEMSPAQLRDLMKKQEIAIKTIKAPELSQINKIPLSWDKLVNLYCATQEENIVTIPNSNSTTPIACGSEGDAKYLLAASKLSKLLCSMGDVVLKTGYVTRKRYSKVYTIMPKLDKEGNMFLCVTATEDPEYICALTFSDYHIANSFAFIHEELILEYYNTPNYL